MGKSSDLTLNASEENYSGGFKVTYTGGNGTLKRGSTVWTAGTSYSISSGSTALTFAPAATGDHTLTFTVTDDHNQEKTATATVKTTFAAMSVGVTPATATAVLNQPVTLTVSASETDYTGKFMLKYSGGTGTLKKGTATLTAGTEIEISSGNTDLVFTPTTPGAHELKFTVTDSYNQSKETMATVTATYSDIVASITPTSPSILIGNSANMTLAFSEQYHSDNFTVSYTGSGSAGTVKLNGQNIASGGSANLAGGSFPVIFTPSAVGSHTLEFEIKDAHSRTKKVSTTVTTSHADMTVSATGGGAVYVNRSKTLTLNASETGYNGSFTVVYTGGTGTLKNGSTTWTAGQTYTIPSGATSVVFTPTTIGAHTLTFKVTDAHNQTKEAQVTVTASQADLTASLTGDGAMYVNRTKTLTLAVSEAEYTGSFRVKYSGGMGTLQSGTTTWVQNTEYTIPSGNTTLNFTPSTTGTHTLTFTVMDDNNQNREVKAVFTVSQATLNASVSPSTQSVMVGSAATSTLAISELEHTGQFTIVPTLSGGTGSLTINGTPVASGGSLKVSGGNQTISYTPTNAATHTLSFAVTDAHSQTQTSTFTVIAAHPEIEASVNSFNVYRNETKEVVLNIAKENYTGTFTVAVKKNSSSGTLTMNGNTVGGTFTTSAGTVRLNYTPSAIGDNSITFTITASDGKKKEVVSSITAQDSPLSISTASENRFQMEYSSGQTWTPRNMNINVSKSHYTGTLMLKYIKTQYEGTNNSAHVTYTVNGSTMPNGSSWNFTGSGFITLTIRATYSDPNPSDRSSFKHVLYFEATDSYNNKTEEKVTLEYFF